MGKFDNLTSGPSAATGGRNNIEDVIKVYTDLKAKLEKTDKVLDKAYKEYEALFIDVERIQKEDKEFHNYMLGLKRELDAHFSINKEFLSKIKIDKDDLINEIESKSKIIKQIDYLAKDNNKSFKMVLFLNLLTIPFQFYILYKFFI